MSSQDRRSLKGEYQALLDFAKKRDIYIKLSLLEFRDIAFQPCTFCGGRTPKYPCNTINYIQWDGGYVKGNVYSVCWPCKRMLGMGKSLKTSLAHLGSMIEYLQTHDLPPEFEA